MQSLKPTDSTRPEPSRSAFASWEAAVLDSVGRSAEQLLTPTDSDIPLRPLYLESGEPADAAGFPGFPPFTRGSSLLWRGWRAVQVYDVAESSQRIAEDVAAGVASFVVNLDRDTSLESLASLFGECDVSKIEIGIEAGPHFVAGADLLRGLWSTRGVPVADAPGGFRADPLGALATLGWVTTSVDTALTQLVGVVTRSASERPCGFDVLVSTRPYHEAGAHPAQELAAAIATGVEYLRVFARAGVEFDVVGPRMLFSMPIDSDIVDGIAKLRALRVLWSRVLELWEVPTSARGCRIEVSTGRRSIARRDPWANLLRGTIAGFVAAVANADRLVIARFTESFADAALPARLARNTQHLLREETRLDAVMDPAGGSALFETRTCELAEAAWERFQRIERDGGMAATLATGALAREIAATHAKRIERLRTRRQTLVGVSAFAARTEDSPPPTLERVENDRPATGATIPERFPLRRWADPFETLQEASGAYRSDHGHSPRIFVVALGSEQESAARVNFLTDVFAAGGFETRVSSPTTSPESAAGEFKASGATLAAIGSSDELYERHAEAVARGLRSAGADRVTLAGRPGEHEAAWRAAGVDSFVFVGADVCAELEALQAALGIRPA